MAKRAKRASRASRRPAMKAKRPRRKSPKRSLSVRPSSRKGARGRKRASRKNAQKATRRRSVKVRGAVRAKVGARNRATPPKPPAKTPRLDRVRRLLADETIPTPPSSLNLSRHASAARTGRGELAENLREHATMGPAITAGDVDANIENAYFSGDEAPGGDNSTPDQDIVDDIGRAVGVEYEDHEELKASDKIAGRDKHRWELDPASSEDYRDRK